MSYTIRFLDGPVGGRVKVLKEYPPPSSLTVTVTTEAKMAEKSGIVTSPVSSDIKVCCYRLWDNWPPRYILDKEHLASIFNTV